jgi:hypothetical protein
LEVNKERYGARIRWLAREGSEERGRGAHEKVESVTEPDGPGGVNQSGKACRVRWKGANKTATTGTACEGTRKTANGATRRGEECGRTKRRVRVAMSRWTACRRSRMRGSRVTRRGKVCERMRKGASETRRRGKVCQRRRQWEMGATREQRNWRENTLSVEACSRGVEGQREGGEVTG